jgi:uncharacterized membrane protein YfcA
MMRVWPSREAMTLPTEVYLLAPLIVVVAYTVYAISGFGSTLIAVPLLAHLLPIKYVVPLVVLLDFAGSAGLGLRFRGEIDRSELKWMLAPLMLGVGIGTTLLLASTPDALVLALGILVTTYGIYSIFAQPPSGKAPRWTGLVAALAGSTMASTVGAGGPLYMMYLSRRIDDKTRLRSTIAAVFAITIALRIVIFVFAGLFLQDGLLLLALMLAPFIFVGLYLGHRLHLRLSRETVLKVVGGLLALAGLSLLRRALL